MNADREFTLFRNSATAPLLGGAQSPSAFETGEIIQPTS